MSNVDDLLEPLRYKNLGDYDLADVRSIGGGVFTENDTLPHLRMLDLIVKAYQSIHSPNYGYMIPRSKVVGTATFSSGTDTSATLFKVPAGEIWELISLSATTGDVGYSNGDTSWLMEEGVPTLALVPLQDSPQPLIYGGAVYDQQLKAYVTYSRKLICGPSTTGDETAVTIKTSWNLSDDTTIKYQYAKVVQ